MSLKNVWLHHSLSLLLCYLHTAVCRARLKSDGTRAETRFGLSAKRTNPFKSAGASVQSTAGSRGVRISGSNGSNAGYTMFWGRVQDYWLPTPLACFPFTSLPVRHRVPSGFNWALTRQTWGKGTIRSRSILSPSCSPLLRTNNCWVKCVIRSCSSKGFTKYLRLCPVSFSCSKFYENP